jgi:phenylacetate-coenzyme A ligase PaaK-like adenylate-forming protein
MDLPDCLIATACRVALYQSLPKRLAWPHCSHTAEDLEAAAVARADPFGGRHDIGYPPDVLIQAARGLPIYWALTARDLSALSTVLAASWTSLGITAGQRVAFYDYATSPMVVFSSRAYVPHLAAGAADILHCLPICNDGLPDLADRCVHILEYVRPSVLFIDAELMNPLLRALDSRRVRTIAQVVVTADEHPVGSKQIREWGTLLGVKVQQALRADAALFVAPPCAIESMTFHPIEDAYRIEVLSSDPEKVLTDEVGRIAISNLAIKSSVVIRYVTDFEGMIREGPCKCGRAGRRLIVTDVG